MRLVVFISALLFALLLQSKILILDVTPAFTVIFPYYIGLTRGWGKGIFTGSFVGILEDSLSGNILGPHLLGKGIVGFLSSFLSGSPFRWTPLLGLLGLFFLTMVNGLSVFVIKTFFDIQYIPLSRLMLTLLLQGTINSMAGVLLRPENAK